MTIEHKELHQGRWAQIPLTEQMAHIGSEVSRALNWRSKGNEDYARKAAERSLELLCLTIDHVQMNSHLKELTRLKELLRDYFFGANNYCSSETGWRHYFDAFASASRKSH